jgi:hypothetical protein
MGVNRKRCTSKPTLGKPETNVNPFENSNLLLTMKMLNVKIGSHLKIIHNKNMCAHKIIGAGGGMKLIFGLL